MSERREKRLRGVTASENSLFIVSCFGYRNVLFTFGFLVSNKTYWYKNPICC